MLYFGYTTPQKFIDAVARQLKLKPNISPYRLQADAQRARIIQPIQVDSQFSVCVSAKYADLGFALVVEMNFAECVFCRSANKFLTIETENWRREAISPYQHKQLRRLSKTIACELYEHIDMVEHMQLSDFLQYHFDALNENSKHKP